MQQPILIDTQVLIWSLENNPALGIKARGLLTDWNQPLVISYFSLQEMTIKFASGKLRLHSGTIDAYLDDMGITVMPAERQTLSFYRIFNVANKDPFDNFLIASDIESGYMFLTADQKILMTKVPGLRLLDARK